MPLYWLLPFSSFLFDHKTKKEVRGKICMVTHISHFKRSLFEEEKTPWKSKFLNKSLSLCSDMDLEVDTTILSEKYVQECNQIRSESVDHWNYSILLKSHYSMKNLASSSLFWRVISHRSEIPQMYVNYLEKTIECFSFNSVCLYVFETKLSR